MWRTQPRRSRRHAPQKNRLIGRSVYYSCGYCRCVRRLLLLLVAAHTVLAWIVMWQNAAFVPFHHGRQVSTTTRQGFQDDNNKPGRIDRVAVMPRATFAVDLHDTADDDKSLSLVWPTSMRNNDSNLTIRVASSVSGCEAKFFVYYNAHDHQQKPGFLWKPSRRRGGALNEWIAYHVSEFLGLHRVPPVRPMSFAHTQLAQAVDHFAQEQVGYWNNAFKCQMKFEPKEWIVQQHQQQRQLGNPRIMNMTMTTTTQQQQQPTETATFILGTLQLLVPHVHQRAELDRAVNQKLWHGWLDRHGAVSAFVQRERDTRRLFDALLGNKDRYNNDFVVDITESSTTATTMTTAIVMANKTNHARDKDNMRLLLYLDNNLLGRSWPVEKPWYCRFYYHIVERLRGTTAKTTPEHDSSFQDDLAQFMTERDPDSQHFVQAWVQAKALFPHRDLSPLFYMNQRRIQLLAYVDACLERHGFDYVFVDET